MENSNNAVAFILHDGYESLRVNINSLEIHEQTALVTNAPTDCGFLDEDNAFESQ